MRLLLFKETEFFKNRWGRVKVCNECRRVARLLPDAMFKTTNPAWKPSAQNTEGLRRELAGVRPTGRQIIVETVHRCPHCDGVLDIEY